VRAPASLARRRHRRASLKFIAVDIAIPPAEEPATERAAFELRAVLDAAVDAVIVIDGRGNIETFNRSAERLFGYEASAVVGRNVSLLMPEPMRGQHDGYLEGYRRTHEAKIIGIGRDVVAQRRDGTTFPASLAVGEIAGSVPTRFVGFIRDITQRRADEEAVKRARDRAQSYLDLAEVMLLAVDPEGRITLINRKGCEILGYPESELVGRDWFDLCLQDTQRDASRRLLARMLANDTQVPRYAEDSVVARDGSTKLIAWRSTVVRDEQGRATGLLSSGEDVTERRRGERELMKSESLLKSAQRIAKLGNFEMVWPAGATFWSEQMYCILGRDPAAGPLAPAEFGAALVHADDRERVSREWDRVLAAGGTLDLEYRIVWQDGTTRDVHTLALMQRNAAAGSTVISGTLHDITDRKLADEELRQGQERLTHVARLSTMGEMAAGLAHEINQPLTAIATYAQAALRMQSSAAGADPADLTEALTQITNQALRAGEVIRRLRSFVKNRAARTETVDLNRLIEELRVLAEPDARVNDVRLALDLAPAMPAVSADPIQIQQVLLNLIRNAIDATLEAPGAPREITVSTSLLDDEVEVAVVDRAGGIDPAIADSLFNPFFTTKADGTGLGLAISRSIIRAHRGKLGYRATPGGGTTFRFTLPLVPGGQLE